MSEETFKLLQDIWCCEEIPAWKRASMIFIMVKLEETLTSLDGLRGDLNDNSRIGNQV